MEAMIPAKKDFLPKTELGIFACISAALLLIWAFLLLCFRSWFFSGGTQGLGTLAWLPAPILSALSFVLGFIDDRKAERRTVLVLASQLVGLIFGIIFILLFSGFLLLILALRNMHGGILGDGIW